MSARGYAEGALSGFYPAPGFGSLAAGLNIHEEFLHWDQGPDDRYGLHHWAAQFQVSGFTFGPHPGTSDGKTFGCLEMIPSATGEGVQWVLGFDAPWPSYPGPGTIITAKFSSSTTSGYEIWAGFCSKKEEFVGVTDDNEFVGVRARGSYIQAVAKDGVSSETAQSSSVTCESYNWAIAGMEIGGTFAEPSYQGFILDCADRGTWSRTNIGAPITTHRPVGEDGCFPCFGYKSTSGSHSGFFDFISISGRCAR